MLIDLPKEHGVFEPEAIEAVCEAFEAAPKDLYDASQPEGVRELSPKDLLHLQARESSTRFAYGQER